MKNFHLFLVSVIFVTIFSVNPANAEQDCSDGCSTKLHLPDKEKPSVRIEFNSPTYSWSSGIFINIEAPSWNTDKNKLDVIGDDPQHSIRISTKNHSIEPFPFIETDPDSGKFYAQLRCTGFLHDADGDGLPEMQPLTFWVSSKMSAIECGRDDAITISFKVTDDLTITKSAIIKWNVGQVKFDKSVYQTSDVVEFTVTDPDMTLLPFPPLATRSAVRVNVYSDSDSSGTIVTAMETGLNGGVFVGHVTLSTKDSSNADRLHVLPGDNIFVKYIDGTLPKPYSLKNTKDIIAQAVIEKSGIASKPILVEGILIQNELPIIQGSNASILANLVNYRDQNQDYVCFIKIINEDGIITSLSWMSGVIPPNAKAQVIKSLPTDATGTFYAEIYFWDSILDANPISEKHYMEFAISK